ncbi:MAG: ATP synthase subunit C [Spirochaetales bacterium]
MKKKITAAIFATASAASAFAQTVAGAAPAVSSSSSAVKYISAALAVGLAAIAGGMAVAKIGAAAMGAMAEKPELSGKALPYVGLAEGICLWGFLVALLILLL